MYNDNSSVHNDRLIRGKLHSLYTSQGLFMGHPKGRGVVVVFGLCSLKFKSIGYTGMWDGIRE